MGPALVTIDEWSAEAVLETVVEINGVPGATQQLSLAGVPETLASLSHRFGFRPGDIVAIGDAANGNQGRRGIQDGDRVVARFSGMALEASIAF